MGKIRRYEAKDFDQVVALNLLVFGDSGKQFEKIHRWLYELNPARDPQKLNCWVFEDGKIFGYVSGMPCLIKIQNKIYRAIIAQNTSVHQQHQGKGKGKKGKGHKKGKGKDYNGKNRNYSNNYSNNYFSYQYIQSIYSI